ncbi:MAG TPA: hypothetical protein VLT33_13395 [Labilithrix sp.]|nr:hypothetical protein [Labilithrix sp.]
MMPTRSMALCTAVLALAGLGVACGSMSASAFEAGDNTPSGAGRGEDAGFGPAATDPNVGVALDNAVILVHAAKSQSFRLCFRNELDRRPQPDSDVMPEANVVGVDVGSTVRLGPLRGAPGEVFLFDEPLIRAVYPQFGGAGQGPTCESLLSASNPLSKLAVSLGTITKSLKTGVHLLVVRGCPGNGPLRSYSTAECGDTWTDMKGNLGITEIELRGSKAPTNGTLSAQLVNLSQPLNSAKGSRDVVVSFGDLKTPGAPLTAVTANPALFGGASPEQPAQLQYTTEDPAIFGSIGFRVSFAAKGTPDTVVLDQTLERVQALSAPRDIPATYYGVASNYALLLLGDPAPKLIDGGPDTDDRRNLHLLAVPVVDPKPDAGSDAGEEPLDAGADQ